ncbi:MAG: DUF5615 family PIN-like protein [Deltaproteobacteria bacterium]|nr:DUF5615 family PIN-like protein [Deltaproteobacteria bacterium]
MKLLADLHISPRTIEFLRSLGHDVVRVNEILPITAADEEIITGSIEERRVIVTQDLDLSALIALSGKSLPSLISLRLHSSRIEYVNALLEKVLPTLEEEVLQGVIISVQDERIRRRPLPISQE